MTEVRCVLYVRISDMDADPNTDSPEEDLRRKVAHQLEWGEAEAKRNGWTMLKLYEERHTGTVRNRPRLNELIADIPHLGVTKVLVFSDDRLGRDDLVTRGIINEVESLGAQVHFGNISLEGMDPVDRELVTGIKFLVTKWERGKIVQRLSRGAARAKAEGTLFSELPKHFVQEEAGFVRPGEDALDMLQRSERGETYGSIAKVHGTYARDVRRTVSRVRRWMDRPPGIHWRRGKKVLRALRERQA